MDTFMTTSKTLTRHYRCLCAATCNNDGLQPYNNKDTIDRWSWSATCNDGHRLLHVIMLNYSPTSRTFTKRYSCTWSATCNNDELAT